MSIVYTIIGLVVAAFVALVLFQLWMVRKMQALRGKPAPELLGRMGKVVKRGRRSMFYFYSPQCGACKKMTPVVTSMGRSSDRVFPVDISKDMDTARRFGVMATPTTIVIENGNILDVIVGPRDEQAIKALMAA